MNQRITKSRFQIARRFLIFWCLFIGIGAVGGAMGMLIDPTGKAMGMDGMLPYFQKLPFAKYVFQNFIFSGISLLIVNGLTNLSAAFLLLKQKKAGVICGMLWGITLMLWICIQFYMFPANLWDIFYFAFGLIQFLTGYASLVFYEQEHFTFEPADYKNIGKYAEEKPFLVLYFSRLGYTQKVAYEVADELGADIEEAIPDEKTDGTLGFWWCGRFGMHGWPMPVKPLQSAVGAYEHVILVSPIWVFSAAAPAKGIAEQIKGKVSEISYVFVHFNPWLPAGAARQLDQILQISHRKIKSVRCNLGHFYESRNQDFIQGRNTQAGL